ncbi:MAG: hypothetical protein RL213_813 [Bacteroidota bacterium]|jgi:adenylyltransferase/sulfurtransferase
MDPLQLKRYSRQTALPGFGAEGQRRLFEASVLVVGAGGLGCPALQYLAGAGIGCIGIVDGDKVSSDNLHRQTLYSESDIGRPKAVSAAEKLARLNSGVRTETYPLRLDAGNATEIISRYDVILDCTDDIPSRYMMDEVCRTLRRPLVYGAVHRYEGQVSVFHGTEATSYCDLFPSQPSDAAQRNCSTDGVLGMLTGIIGMVQASEALSLAIHRKSALEGKLWTFDLRTMTSETFSITPATDTYRAVSPSKNSFTIPSLSFSSMPQDTLLLDVREEYEYGTDDAWTEGKEVMRIPLSDLSESMHRLPRKRTIAVFCTSGYRSRIAARLISAVSGYDSISTLEPPTPHEER